LESRIFLFTFEIFTIIVSAMPVFLREHDSWMIRIGSKSARCCVILAILGLASILLHRSSRIFIADRIVRGDPSFEGFSKAIRFDPGNAEHWWNRGKTQHYTVGAVNLDQAISDYRHALFLNPRIGQAWTDLADCLERTGRYDEAETAIRNALKFRPHSPITRWQAGNYFLRRGNLEGMYENFRVSCLYDREKLDIATHIAWQMESDRSRILTKLIPDDLAGNLSYVQFLAGRDELDLGIAAWKRAIANEIPPDSEFRIDSSFLLIDRLLAMSRFEDSLRIWDDTLVKAGTGLRDQRFEGKKQAAESLNLIWNGSFESEIRRGGLDWRLADIPESKITLDLQDRIEGLKSLKISFSGANLGSALLSEILPVFTPGRYVFTYHVRTQGLTTDQTPYFQIQGFPDPSGAGARAEMLPAEAAWKRVSIPFEIGPGCRGLQVLLRRDVSGKFDNLLKGTLWLDGISIRKETAIASRGEASSGPLSSITADPNQARRER
jgi:tetratricopeptide (TPR) repeat protein